MKRVLVLLLVLIIVLFALPLFILKGCEKEVKEENNAKIHENFDSTQIVVFNAKQNKLQEMNLEEYVLGVLAAEMPSKFDIEALKAQALAARTYTLMKTKSFGGKGCDAHPGADVCTEFVHCQAYVDPESIEFNYDKYKEAVLATKGEVIVYDNALIQAVFHSTSGGKTENSEDIWTSEVPYLRSVSSEYEDDSPKLKADQVVKVNDFIAAMKKIDSKVKLSTKSIQKQIKILERSEGGRITRLSVGGKELSGSSVRTALGLNSSNFNISYQGDTMKFTVLGNGHGVGLSQYGADGMAQNGSKYDEIIKHYYVGVKIVNLEDLVKTWSNNSYKASN